MLRAACLVTAEGWSKLRCPSTKQQFNKTVAPRCCGSPCHPTARAMDTCIGVHESQLQCAE